VRGTILCDGAVFALVLTQKYHERVRTLDRQIPCRLRIFLPLRLFNGWTENAGPEKKRTKNITIVGKSRTVKCRTKGCAENAGP